MDTIRLTDRHPSARFLLGCRRFEGSSGSARARCSPPTRIARLPAALAMAGLLAATAAVPQPAHSAPVCTSASGEARCRLDFGQGWWIEGEGQVFAERLDLTGGFDVSGSVVVGTPGFALTLGEAALAVAPDPWGFYFWDGSASLPIGDIVPSQLFAQLGIPLPEAVDSMFAIRVQPYCRTGSATRDGLAEMFPGAPNLPKHGPEDVPTYRWFHCDTGSDFDFTPLALLEGLTGWQLSEAIREAFTLQAVPDESLALIFNLNPDHFYLYLTKEQGFAYALAKFLAGELADRADASAKPEAGPVDGEEAEGREPGPSRSLLNQVLEKWEMLETVGFSLDPDFPFAPQTTFGIEAYADSLAFDANFLLAGNVPFPGLLTAQLDGEIAIYGGDGEFDAGGNGALSMSLTALKGSGWIAGLFDPLDLGDASIGFGVRTDPASGTSAAYQYASGEWHPQLLGDGIPLVPQQVVYFGLYWLIDGLAAVSAPPPQFDGTIALRSGWTLSPGILDDLIAGIVSNPDLTLQDLYILGTATLNRQYLDLRGEAFGRPHKHLDFGGEASLALHLPFDGKGSYFEMAGNATIAGVGLREASFRVSESGVFVRGNFVAPLSTISVSGDPAVGLAGTGHVRFPMAALTQATADLREDVAAAQADVARLDVLIARARAEVQAERDAAQRDLKAAQAQVNGLQSEIDANSKAIAVYRAKIAANNRDISSKYRWYTKQPWYAKPSAYAQYLAYSAGKTAQNAGWSAAIAGLEIESAGLKVALATATAALDVAKAAVVGTPVDVDPRVWPHIAARETATAVLAAAEAALAGVPPIDRDLRATLHLVIDEHGPHGTLSAEAEGFVLADARVVFEPTPEACFKLAGEQQVCTPF